MIETYTVHIQVSHQHFLIMPFGYVKIAIDSCDSWLIYPLKIVCFYGYVNVYQGVVDMNLPTPMTSDGWQERSLESSW